jgi:hypothetical protein
VIDRRLHSPARTHALVSAGTLASLALACGSSSTGAGAGASGDSGTTHMTGTTSDGGYPYPSTNPGFNARKGTIPGNQIMNYTFQGYPNGDEAKGLQTITLADFYDPDGKKGYKLLHLDVGALWCGPCNQETVATVPLVPMYAKEGVVFAQAIDQGAAVGVAATTTDLNNWVTKYKSNFTEMLDPNDAQLGTFFDASAVPWNAIIDTRTMEILTAGTGYSGDLESDIAPWLTWVAKTPPSYPVP